MIKQKSALYTTKYNPIW